MIKIIVFDLDNTLAPHGKGITQKTIKQLKQLENQGVLVALCSGKTAFYLSGLLRQIQLKNPIIVGENGAEMKIGIDLPPKVFNLIKVPKKTLKQLAWVERNIKKLFNDELWFQHNRFGVSPFPRSKDEFEKIQNFINKNKRKFKNLCVYRHPDCFDITAKQINKKAGLENLLNVLKIKPTQMLAVGDSANDYPMFELAGFSIGVNVKDKEKVDIDFKTIDQAMNFILKHPTLKQLKTAANNV